MQIQGLETLLRDQLFTETQPKDQGFQAMLQQGIQDLNQTTQKSMELSNQFAAGENVALHDVMIASQEADLAMRLAVQLRNKALEAYREIIRMPV